MTFYYVDTSVVIRAYFVDEVEHEFLRQLLLEGDDPVVSSELTRVEFASAAAAAFRSQRVPDLDAVLDQFDLDCSNDGVLTLLQLDTRSAMPLARDLVTQHHVRTLDALHLAVALTTATQIAAGEPVTMLTRDRRQADAARACGLPVA